MLDDLSVCVDFPVRSIARESFSEQCLPQPVRSLVFLLYERQMKCSHRSIRLRRAYTISNAQEQYTRWSASFPSGEGGMAILAPPVCISTFKSVIWKRILTPIANCKERQAPYG